MIVLINSLGLLLPVLLSVAFITLIERKWLATTQRRVGPNIVGIFGLLQPFADALKLILKENVFPGHSNKVLFYVAPIITLIASLLGWSIIPLSNGNQLIDSNNSIFLSLAVSSLGIYGILIGGWAANSKYALFGSFRCTAQIVSYELTLGSSILTVVLLHNSWNWNHIIEIQSIINIWPLLPIFIIFIISAIAESNRAPYDIVEAESELVAGFIVEHSSVPFVLFFLAEYGSLVLLSTWTVFLFFGGSLIFVNPIVAAFFVAFKITIICLIFVLIRSTLPRLRYDILIQICWIDLLPLAIAFVLLVPSILFCFEAYSKYSLVGKHRTFNSTK